MDVLQSSKVYDMKLRELEPLLSKKLGDELKVISYEAKSLMPPGEHFGGTILKVRALVKHSKDAKEEELQLIAKMQSGVEAQRKMFDNTFTFKKEAYMYEKVIPSYHDLEREKGISNVFDITPELYGVRYSLKGDGEVDDDAVLLLENLRNKHFYLADRRTGLDLAHARVVVIALARFHALGIATKQHRPDYFKELKEHAKMLPFDAESLEQFKPMMNLLMQTMSADPELAVHLGGISAAFGQMAQVFSDPSLLEKIMMPREPWASIIHSDFWINNFLFRKDPQTDTVAEIKFIDFQNFLYSNPLAELAFFLLTNLNMDIMDEKFDELLDLYYERFTEQLRKMNCDLNGFSRESFDEGLKQDAIKELMHCVSLLKVMTNDKENLNLMVILMDQSENVLFLPKLRKCINMYARKGWFPNGYDTVMGTLQSDPSLKVYFEKMNAFKSQMAQLSTDPKNFEKKYCSLSQRPYDQQSLSDYVF